MAGQVSSKLRYTQRSYLNLGGINLYNNPLEVDGMVTRVVNMIDYPAMAKRKRGGYGTFLNNPDNAQVNTLIDWHRNDGTTFNLYRASGSVLYYSTQGTGNWTICGNGTFTNNANLGETVLEDVLIVGDGVTATRHSIDGTSFVNTTNAPIASYFENFQGRVYAGGTSSNLFYSSTGTASDWTTDSSSILIPGGGKINSVFKTKNNLMTTKNSEAMFRYDGYSLFDMTTNTGPSSANSIAFHRDSLFWLNKSNGGFIAYDGQTSPAVFSNPIQRQIYNPDNTGIAGSIFSNNPSIVHYNNFLSAVGSVKDDLTGEPVNNCIENFNLITKSWSNWSLFDNPTAWLSYQDNNLTPQLIFANSSGQCFVMNGATSDNGNTIESTLELTIHLNSLLNKDWRYIRLAFNPGCTAQVQVATGNTFPLQTKNWKNLGDAKSGIVEYHFPSDNRGVFCFIKINEASQSTPWNLYGIEVNYAVVPAH